MAVYTPPLLAGSSAPTTMCRCPITVRASTVTLQYRMFGSAAYWYVIAPECLANAAFFPSSHHKYWTETWASCLAKGHFRGNWIGGLIIQYRILVPLINGR